MTLIPIATSFPKIKNLHSNSLQFSIFYTLFTNMDGAKAVKAGIVEQPKVFNEREYRRKMATIVAGYGTLIQPEMAKAIFHELDLSEYITKY